MRIGFPRASGRRGGFRWWVILAAVGYFAWYYFSHQETVPMTGRSQLVAIDSQQEMALGLQSYRQVLSQERVLQSGEVVDAVREIGRRLALAAADYDPGFDWEFNVIDSSQANAFALPGGKVAVYAGLISVAENVDALAAVMGHEIAHAIARHGAERMSHEKLMQMGQMAVSVAVGDMDPSARMAVMQAFGLGAQYGALLPFSREHESEADYMGLLLMARACFNPQEAPGLWQRMARASSGPKPSEFASTHPSHETRIQQLQRWMPEAVEMYRDQCAG
ncbi:M48 family metallopeptidase [Gammaproteobacteria bacterium]|nr:M48 family metallopeptidase [Gammaproteobacteria bacterium]